MFARLRAPAGWLGALLLLVTALRAAGFVFGVTDIDETDFLLFGRAIGLGGLPYVELVDIKPPLTFLFYAPAALFGFHMWPMQVIGLLWTVATCLMVGRAARAWIGSPVAEKVGAFTCALVAAGNACTVDAEMMLNLPAAAALLCFVRAEADRRRRYDALAGVFIGLAALFKHQAGILLLALSLALVARWVRGERAGMIGRLLLLGLGFTAPWAVVALGYAAAGHFDAFYEWNVARNLLYVGAGASGSLVRLLESVSLFVVGGAPLAWLLAARASRPGPDPVRNALALCLWMTWIPVSLGGRWYGHYFMQFGPPLALLATPSMIALVESWPRRSRASRAVIAALVVLPLLGHQVYAWGRGLIGRYPCQDPRAIEVAQWVREHSTPDERVFVWGHYAPIYYLAERLPGTRYTHTAVHMGDFDPHHIPAGFDFTRYRSARDIASTLDDLATRRPALVVDTAPADIHEWSKVPLDRFPEIAGYIADHYQLVGRPAGAAVYRRRSGGAGSP